MKTLIAISGGCDSTYLLWKLLSEGDDVHAFLIDFSEVQPDPQTAMFYTRLHELERPVCERIYTWLMDNGFHMTFDIVPSGLVPIPAHYPRSANTRAWRVLPMLVAASKLASGCDRFVYGKTAENRRSPDYQTREQFDQVYWRQIAPAGVTFEMPLIDQGLTRSHALRDMPAGLQALVLACDTPMMINGQAVACGACSKCVMMADARSKLAAGKSPEEIQERHLELRRAGQFTGRQSGDTRFGG